MNSNKYIIAIGVALSFLVASLNATECPAGPGIDQISKSCVALLNNSNKLTPEQWADANNPTVKKYKENFYGESACESVVVTGQSENKTHARCELLIGQDACAKEPTACRWSNSGEECVGRARSKINFGCLEGGATASEGSSGAVTAAACKAVQGTCITGGTVSAENPDCNGGDIRTPCEEKGCVYLKNALPKLACFATVEAARAARATYESEPTDKGA